MSFNFDELENSTIVDPKLLTVIGRLADFPIRSGECYHAGLIHTYGYLFSNLKTRFGYKRERWTDGRIASALGLAPDSLLGITDDSTLLQNVTFLMGRIAFDDKTQQRKVLRLPGASNAIKLICYENLQVERIEERVRIGPRNTTLRLYTDLVRFRRSAPIDSLLVYSYRHRKKQQLVTCFSMSSEGRKELVATAKANESLIRARFNLAIPGFEKEGLSGTRTITARHLPELG